VNKIAQIEDALVTLLGARKLLRKRSVHWVNQGPDIDIPTAGMVGDHCAVTAINRAAMAKAVGQDDAYSELMNYYDPENDILNCMILEEANRVHPQPAERDFDPYSGKRVWARDKYDSIPDWNDASGRTKRQVLGVFTRVIKKLHRALPAQKRKKYDI